MCMVIIYISVIFIIEIIESVSASKVRYEKIAAGVGPGSIRNINEVRHDRGCQNPERWK